MTAYQRPPQLKPGDTIGIVSPSSTIEPFPRRLRRGIQALESLGFKVRLGDNCTKTFGKAGGTPQERADDINTFFKDASVRAILCSTGGFNANSVLPLLDYELIKANPKIFCGYSDITALNLAISAKTGLVTFNGPTLLPSFGEKDGPFPFTAEQFKKVLCDIDHIGVLPAAEFSSDENLWWDKEDDRPSATRAMAPPRSLYGGQAEGVLLGGNLETIMLLGGTEYMPDLTGSILFLEEMGGDTAIVERNLTYLEQLGIFSKISGFVYGRPYRFDDDDSRPLSAILASFAEHYRLPAIMNLDCGHTNPMLTMPLGVHAALDADNATITITGSAVV
jgi:muramoyltetrapeptide carboxypeptidase